jgi:hypothetical protein
VDLVGAVFTWTAIGRTPARVNITSVVWAWPKGVKISQS